LQTGFDATGTITGFLPIIGGNQPASASCALAKPRMQFDRRIERGFSVRAFHETETGERQPFPLIQLPSSNSPRERAPLVATFDEISSRRAADASISSCTGESADRKPSKIRHARTLWIRPHQFQTRLDAATNCRQVPNSLSGALSTKCARAFSGPDRIEGQQMAA